MTRLLLRYSGSHTFVPNNSVVPGFSKMDCQFQVQGKGEITVRYETRHAGTLEKEVKLD